MFCIFLSLSLCQRESSRETPLTRFAGAPLKEGSRDPVRYWLPSTEGSQRISGLVVAVGTEAGARPMVRPHWKLGVSVPTPAWLPASVTLRKA